MKTTFNLICSIITNTNVVNFDDKLNKVYNAISSLLNIPEVGTIQRKFLIEGDAKFDASVIPDDVDSEQFTEVITYLKPTEENYRAWLKVRTSGNNNKHFTYINRRIAEVDAEKRELKRKVSPHIFEEYTKQRDATRNELQRDLVLLVWNNQAFNVETTALPSGKYVNILRCTADSLDEEIKLPEFIKVQEEITNIEKYHTYTLSDPEYKL